VGLVALLLSPVPAAAQTAALESQRQAVFAQLLSAPTNRALMLQYARLSVQMRDFEAAASTLERFLDLEPENAAVRLELAIAYFSLGAYDVAEYHLATANAIGGLTPAQVAQAARYADEAADRDAPQGLSGRIALGASRTESFDDSGRFGTAQLAWRIDMGGANAEDWLTEFSATSYQSGNLSFYERQIMRLRTGPEFRLTGETYGPRLQPYVEISSVERGDFNGSYVAAAIGLAYQNPHTAFWTSHADLQIGRAETEFDDRFDFAEASVGLTYRPSRETRIRGTLRWRSEEWDFFEATTSGLRLEALHTFDTGLDYLPRRWEVRGWALWQTVEEDFGGFFTDRFDETAYGAGLRAFVTQNFFVEGRAARMQRDFGSFTDEETLYSLQLGWEF
jgi:tetratricopeptide (TPR) repeat protein